VDQRTSRVPCSIVPFPLSLLTLCPVQELSVKNAADFHRDPICKNNAQFGLFSHIHCEPSCHHKNDLLGSLFALLQDMVVLNCMINVAVPSMSEIQVVTTSIGCAF
jgi:hypothetical protein